MVALIRSASVAGLCLMVFNAVAQDPSNKPQEPNTKLESAYRFNPRPKVTSLIIPVEMLSGNADCYMEAVGYANPDGSKTLVKGLMIIIADRPKVIGADDEVPLSSLLTNGYRYFIDADEIDGLLEQLEKLKLEFKEQMRQKDKHLPNPPMVVKTRGGISFQNIPGEKMHLIVTKDGEYKAMRVWADALFGRLKKSQKIFTQM